MHFGKVRYVIARGADSAKLPRSMKNFSRSCRIFHIYRRRVTTRCKPPKRTVPVSPIKAGLNVHALDHFFSVLYGIGTPNNLAASFFSCGVFFSIIFYVDDEWVCVCVSSYGTGYKTRFVCLFLFVGWFDCSLNCCRKERDRKRQINTDKQTNR